MQKENQGLSGSEAAKRLGKYGPNRLFEPTKIKFWAIFKEEVTEPMILLLFTVGFFYSIWGKLEDAITIVFVISVLVLTEVNNEFRAKKAINALGEIAAPKARVLRNGQSVEVNTENIVPGDILILFQGSRIPADAKLVSSVNLTVDEATLTGESVPIEKSAAAPVFAGTIVVSGQGQAEVQTTGRQTKFGQIAENLKAIKIQRTKLQLQMKSLAGKLVYVAVAVSVLIPLIGILRGEDLKTMLLTGLALSFAVIPEELPMVITMVLGLGSYRLSKKKLLVKKIMAAETLGTVTTIVTDKTGTITTGVMTPVFFYPATKEEIIAKAVLTIDDFSPLPLDRALLKEAGRPAGAKILRQRDMSNIQKTIATLIEGKDGHQFILRGAPEEVFLASTKVDVKAKEELAHQTQKGRRVIAVAAKNITGVQTGKDFKDLETDLDFIGLIGFEDSPRPTVKETIATVYAAGIRTIMVTGDHPATAEYIASKVGIQLAGQPVLTGEDIAKMTSAQLQTAVKETSIFARTSPQDKFLIVKALQQNGEVVAVTGDGVNDALALKTADIGIAMGIKGTDVAKEAAGVILADDNYTTIARGVFEGRKLFDNLKKGIKYYLSVKLALVLIFLVPVVLGLPTPFAPIQIIVLEMFMDLAASAGYVAELTEKDVYGNFRGQTQEGVLGKSALKDMILKGAVLFATVTAVYLYALSQHVGALQAQTLAFATWIFSHVFLAFVSRSDRQPLLAIGIFKNKIIDLWGLGAVLLLFLGMYVPILRTGLGLTVIPLWQVCAVMVLALLTASLVEVNKSQTNTPW
jgi:P-type Ca2+ transporter type 2C